MRFQLNGIESKNTHCKYLLMTVKQGLNEVNAVLNVHIDAEKLNEKRSKVYI